MKKLAWISIFKKKKKNTKTKIMAFGPITSWETEGEKVEGWKVLFSWVLKSVWTATEPWNQKTLAPWKESYDKPEVKWSEVSQLGPTLRGPMDCSLPGSSIHGIFQARVLEWVAISFCSRSSWPRDRTWVSLIVGRHFYHLSHLEVWQTR